MLNLSQNELNQMAEMRDQSRDELERIAKIRRIKNYEEMSKEELILSVLKSKQSTAEFFNNLDNDKISDIRRILNRLRDMLPKRYRKEIKKKLYEIENNEDLSEAEKKEDDEYIRKFVRNLNNKEKYSPYDCDDFDYYGIRDILNLFDEDSGEDYYKPILVKSFFNGNYKYYESRGDKEKRLSVKQYLNKITQHLYDLINDHKIARKVWRIQISMRLSFISSKDTGETHTIYVWYGVITKALCEVVTQIMLLENFLSLF